MAREWWLDRLLFGFFQGQYSSMETGELVGLTRKGHLTEVASKALSSVLAERGVSPEQCEEIAKRLKEEPVEASVERLAPVGRRFLGEVADVLIGLVFAAMAGYVGSAVSIELTRGAFFIYVLLADGLPSGQSLGKRLMGIAVVASDTNEPCGYGRSLLRNLPLLFLCLLDVLFIFGKRRRRLGDMLAGTDVIKVEYLR